jgi:alkanesulfonate monooxygenase SsuD/methylene tetrahydromethanopterin reductase-like flavin-dependent oxidoreductase (luciferase family)
MAATLDELSGGRFLCGIGVSNPTIAGWHGLEYDAPLRRIEEYIDIFRKVIRQDKLQYQGKKYSSKGFRLPFTPIRKDIPVYIAALRPRMTALAGKLSDGVMITLGTPDHVREQVAQMRQAAEEAGRDPQSLDVIVEVMCCVNDDLELAKTPLKKACTFYGLADFYGDMFAREGFADEIEAMRASYRKGGFRAALAQISDEMLLRLPVVAATNTDQIRRRLDDYEAAGATRVILAYTPVTNDPTTEVLQFLQGW